MTPDQQAPPADQPRSADDALEWLRQRLTEDNFPFFNRHPHHTTSETWAMWAERDVLAEIEAVRDALRQAPPTDLREQVKNALLNHGHKPENELLDDLADAVLAVFAERERAPDESPGDVIAAEPDGTIVLDDAITTWNPARAIAFLLAERERLLRERIEALDWTDGVHTAAAAGFHAAITEVLGVFNGA